LCLAPVAYQFLGTTVPHAPGKVVNQDDAEKLREHFARHAGSLGGKGYSHPYLEEKNLGQDRFVLT
jgi:hypothetical protein